MPQVTLGALPTPFVEMSAFRTLAVFSLAVALAAATASMPVVAHARAGSTARCGGVEVAAVRGGPTTCTHGGDPLPPTGPRLSHATLVAVPPAPCPDDGVGGPRVRVLYGYPKGTKDRVKQVRSSIQQAVALADFNLDLATPGVEGQHYRFFCKHDTSVSVKAVKLVGVGGDAAFTFGDVLDSLQNQVAYDLGPSNLDDPRFVYAVFVDHIGCCYPFGGQASLYGDDTADPAVNLNNAGFAAKYAMIRLGFPLESEATVFQHEVGHNLGAVQDSSPHSSGAFHCYDGNDIMCYADGGSYFSGGGSMTYGCAMQSDGLSPFDCGQDDYYNPAPATGSYLDSHWDLVNSAWLSWTP